MTRKSGTRAQSKEWPLADLFLWQSQMEADHGVLTRIIIRRGTSGKERQMVMQAYRIEDGKPVVLGEDYVVLGSRQSETFTQGVVYLVNKLDGCLFWEKAMRGDGLPAPEQP